MDLRIDFLTRLFSFALIGDRVDLCGDNVGIADVFLGNEFAFVIEGVNQRHTGRDVEAEDFVFAHAFKRHREEVEIVPQGEEEKTTAAPLQIDKKKFALC